MIKLGIIGNGYVGSATALLSCPDVSIKIYDIIPDKCNPINTKLSDLMDSDLIFICVPTPMHSDGSCSLKYIEDVMQALDKLNYPRSQIILRSTVPVGTSKIFNVNFMPEFLTEKNWQNDFRENKTFIIGLNHLEQKPKIVKLFRHCCEYGVFRDFQTEVKFCSTSEAELVKLTRNAYLASKVSFFNEINSYCENAHLNFNIVRELVCKDPRIGNSHSYVPGPDDKKGYGGICLPKDTHSLIQHFETMGIESPILNAVNYRNEEIDRKERDWLNAKGRATIE